MTTRVALASILTLDCARVEACARKSADVIPRTRTRARSAIRSHLSHLSHRAAANVAALPRHVPRLTPPRYLSTGTDTTEPQRSLSISDPSRQHCRKVSQPVTSCHVDAARMHACMHSMHESMTQATTISPSCSLPLVFVPGNLSTGRHMPPHATATTWDDQIRALRCFRRA